MQLGDPRLIAVVLMVSILDIIFVIAKTPVASRLMPVIGNRLSLSAYFWGVLGGHALNASSSGLHSATWTPFFVVVVVGLALAGIHWIWWTYLDAPDWLPFVHLIVGCGMGATLIPV